MVTSLSNEELQDIFNRLGHLDRDFVEMYPGETGERQAVHTTYGGAHLFKADRAHALGEVALKVFHDYARDPFSFARAIGLPGADTLPRGTKESEALSSAVTDDPEAVQRSNPSAWLAATLHRRVENKLLREPVEDIRIDFEDGYGAREDAEEDRHAGSAALEVAKGMDQGSLPPFIGIRIKPLSEELCQRSIRTLDLFVTTLVDEAQGCLPENFVVTLPKVVVPEQVAALSQVLDSLESKNGLAAGAIKIELLIEVPQAIITHEGTSPLLAFAEAGDGRCVSAHFGAYDYTASCSITAANQQTHHAACSFAKHLMQAAFAGTGIWLADGMTNVLPVPPHRAAVNGEPLAPFQVEENIRVVHDGWRLHYDNVHRSLLDGFYQGCDVHPSQFPTRYAATYAFFLEGLEAASTRLRNFIEKAGQATRAGEVMDAIATGQGLLNFFLRALSCSAITDEEAATHTGLTLDELRCRSFRKILQDRRAPPVKPPADFVTAEAGLYETGTGD